MKEKIEAFAKLVQDEQEQRLLADSFTVTVRDGNHKTSVHEGKKYTRVDIGNSGRFMVENATGNIFGTKGYGVVHKGHFYGTVETINEYNWGNYYPSRKDDGLKTQKASNCPVITHAPTTVVV